MASVGYATLDIIPSMRGMHAQLEKGLALPMLAAGRKSGEHLSTGVGQSIKRRGRSIGGSLATHMGVGFAAIGVGAIVKSSVQLEASFSKTLSQIAVATGAPKSAIKSLHDEALRMGAATKYSANEAAGAMLELGKSGISTRDIMGGGLKGTLTLAAAGDLELGSAATIASNAMNTFNLRGKDMGNIAAALAGGANASTASVESLGQALAQVGPGAKNAGLDLQTTVGALAAFDQAGIKGSDAGTSLKTFLARLVPMTQQAQTAMESYGLATYNANAAQKTLAEGGFKMTLAQLKNEEQANLAIQKMLVQRGQLDKQHLGDATGKRAAIGFEWASGIQDSAFTDAKGNFQSLGTIADALAKHLSGLSQSQRTAALTTLFGSDATRAATVLMNEGSKGLEKFIKATKDQGAAQKMAKANMSGTAGALERLSGAVETAKLKLGEALAPTVRKLANYLSSTAVPALTKFVDQMQSGKGTGGEVARDLETIYDAAKKVVEIGGKVAHAFDGLPDGLKKAIAVGGIGALLASRVPGVKGLTRGLTGSAVKSITGGVQKVFVVNPGFGGLPGKGGKLPPVGTWTPVPGMKPPKGSGFALGAALRTGVVVGLKAIAGGIAMAVSQNVLGSLGGKRDKGVFSPFIKPGTTRTKGVFGPGHTLDHDASRAYKAITGPGGGAGLKVEQAIAAVTGANSSVVTSVNNMKKLDAALSKLDHKDPAAGAAAYAKVLKESGLSAAQLAKILPKTAKAMGAVAAAAAKVARAKERAGLNFESLRFSAEKAGIGSQRLNKMLRSLPLAVRTKIATPGSLQSHKAIKELAKQYGLTPKQVQTIIKLVGARDAQDNTKKTRDGLRILNTTTAKPHIEIQGAQDARAAARSVRRSLAAIHDVHAKISINAETNQYANKRNAQGFATGGWINGPGTATSDSIPALLSNGEFVVNAASAQRYRRELEAMNVQRFANGGSVGGGSVPSGRGGQEIRGTLSIDRDGVAYIHGVSRDEVHHHAAAQQAAARSAAMSL